mmetsp:Transcript_23946/g.66453  ORF Transcript_23946/g.66453 Transcript_23946/m.66453 type:complete len:298 (+) Transcript_23946:139-1032(+)|eukprot:CAMPEP_0168737000 /NCGR_PEP_ID=MMETSP0724-20121128/10156_1 /TAXON_ID=265536 /ORGANISM="Amphiprora sp., Strain CCMP467" /LENGTH=297 /DNA_ID=CAMNT_0008784227 /DNA_START=135 /DNA_END=1028 /DNA_ORIENTATION=-
MAKVEPITSPPPPSSSFWALNSNDGELDLALQAAQREAEREYLEDDEEQRDNHEEPLILRNLLSDEQIAQILREASADGVWPRGIYKDDGNDDAAEPLGDHNNNNNNDQEELPASAVDRSALCHELRSVPHHFAWTEGHVVLYMHNNKHWFVRTLTDAWSAIRGGMEARPWMNGAIPILDTDFLAVGCNDDDDEDDPSMARVRTVELHHYGVGGGLLTPGHRDCGSELTISVLLSDSDRVSGGDFVTYGSKGVPVAHKLNRGDAILFRSEMLHNISTITAGVRKSLVVELWPSNRSS